MSTRSPCCNAGAIVACQYGKKRITVETRGRLTLNDPGTMLSTLLSGYGVAQILALGHEQLLADGKLIDLFPDWPDERFPLYAFYPSRHRIQFRSFP